MSKDTSLEEIDIVKLLIYVFAFIAVCLVMIFAFIVPNIKEYRAVKQENRAQIANMTKINQIYSDKNSALSELMHKDEAIFKAFNAKFSEENFVQFAANYFSDVKLSQLPPQDSDEPFFRYELNVTSSVQTPVKFYNFIDALQRYDNIIRVDFPIHMQGGGERIRTTFNIKVYGVK